MNSAISALKSHDHIFHIWAHVECAQSLLEQEQLCRCTPIMDWGFKHPFLITLKAPDLKGHLSCLTCNLEKIDQHTRAELTHDHNLHYVDKQAQEQTANKTQKWQKWPNSSHCDPEKIKQSLSLHFFILFFTYTSYVGIF